MFYFQIDRYLLRSIRFVTSVAREETRWECELASRAAKIALQKLLNLRDKECNTPYPTTTADSFWHLLLVNRALCKVVGILTISWVVNPIWVYVSKCCGKIVYFRPLEIYFTKCVLGIAWNFGINIFQVIFPWTKFSRLFINKVGLISWIKIIISASEWSKALP